MHISSTRSELIATLNDHKEEGMADLKGIFPPKDGWKESTWYLVEVSFRKGNPVHYNLFFTGFLNGYGGSPGGYNCLVPHNGVSNGERISNIHNVRYMSAVKVLASKEELNDKPWMALL